MKIQSLFINSNNKKNSNTSFQYFPNHCILFCPSRAVSSDPTQLVLVYFPSCLSVSGQHKLGVREEAGDTYCGPGQRSAECSWRHCRVGISLSHELRLFSCRGEDCVEWL